MNSHHGIILAASIKTKELFLKGLQMCRMLRCICSACSFLPGPQQECHKGSAQAHA